MANGLIISTIVEYLDEGPSGATATFGVALSVGVDAAVDAAGNLTGTTPTAVVEAARWACPWLWELTSVALATVDDNGTVTPFQPDSVELLGVHATSLKPQPPAERSTLVKRLHERFVAIRDRQPARFAWSGQPETGEGEEIDVPEGKVPPLAQWPLELQGAGQLGAPHAQWVNVSIFFTVTGALPAGAAALVASPQLTLRRLAPDVSSRDGNESDDSVAVRPDVATDEGGRTILWTYAAVAGQSMPAELPSVRARCARLRLPLRERKWWVHDPKGVAVRAWRATLLTDIAARTSPPRLIARAAREQVKSLSGAAAGAALRTARDRIVDAAFWLLPTYAPHDGVALTDLVEGLANANANDQQRQAASTLRALRAQPARSELAANGALARAATVRDALRRAGFGDEVLAAGWASTLARAEDVTRALTELELFATGLATDTALLSLWMGAVNPPLAASEYDALRKVLDNRGALVGAMQTDLLRPTWNLVTAAEKPPSATDFGTSALRWITALSTDAGGQPTIPAPLVSEIGDAAETAWSDVTDARESYVLDRDAALPMVPHPIVVTVGTLSADPGLRAGGTAAADWDDTMRHQLGVGLLVRERSASAQWRCPTLGVPADVAADGARFAVTPLGTTLTVVPGQQTYRDNLATNTMSYEGRWIGAVGPEEQLNNHGLVAPAAGEPAPLFYFAAPPTAAGVTSSWSRLPLPKFSRTLELAAFQISLTGALPPSIRDAADPGALRSHAAATKPAPRGEVASHQYRRAVPVGAPRIGNIGGASYEALRLPAVPGSTYLRAREIPGPAYVASARGDVDAVLLLSPEIEPSQIPAPPIPTASVPSQHTIGIRPPALANWDTWFRWQFMRSGAPTNDQIAGIHAVIKRREMDLHEAVVAKVPTSKQAYTLDDPSVSALGVVLLEYAGVAGDGAPDWKVCGSQRTVRPRSGEPPVGDASGVWLPDLPETAATNAARIPVRFVARRATATATLKAEGDGLVASLREGKLYQLLVYALVDASVDADWVPMAIKRFSDETLLPRGVSFAGYRQVSMTRLSVEVATPEWWPSGDDVTRQDDIYRSLRSTVSRSAANTRVIELEAVLDGEQYPTVYGLDLYHQRWRWSGRPISRSTLRAIAELPHSQAGWLPYPARGLMADADAAVAAEKAMSDWEVAEFGDLAEGGSILPMELELLASGTAARRVPARRQYRHAFDMAGDETASYHRFAVAARHRYEGVYGLAPLACRMDATLTKGEKLQWRWHSRLLKAEPRRAPSPVVMRRLIPIASTAQDSALKTAGPLTAGFMAIASDEAFVEGGLAEMWQVGVLLESGYGAIDQPQGAVNPRYARSETPDAAWVDAARRWRDEPADGPFGHTLEPQVLGARVGRFGGHSYIVRPPIGEKALDVPWLARFRIGRAFDARLVEEAYHERLPSEPEWVETPWLPLQPDRRRLATGESLDGAYIVVSNEGRTITVHDAAGRAVAETPSREAAAPAALDTMPVAVRRDNTTSGAYLFVQQVISEIGGARSERYVGLYAYDGNAWQRLPLDGATPVSSLEYADDLVARLLYVSHIDTGFTGPSTEEAVWQRLLGDEVTRGGGAAPSPTAESIRGRMAYDGLSPPLYRQGAPRVADPALCGGG